MVAPARPGRTIITRVGELEVIMSVDGSGKPAVDFKLAGETVVGMFVHPETGLPAVAMFDGDRLRAQLILQPNGPGLVILDNQTPPVPALTYNLQG